MLNGASTQQHEEDDEIGALHLDRPIQLRQFREVEAMTCEIQNRFQEMEGAKLTRVREGPAEKGNSTPNS